MKKVLITGGNGDIAKAVACSLAQLPDYEVRLPGKDEMDVTDPQSVERFLSGWVPDILINNAGFVAPQSIGNCDIELEKKTLDINLFGVFNCTAATLRYNPEARIVNIGSSAATKVHGTWAAYCAAKAAVVMATQCWAADGKQCVCISPGRTATKMRAGLYPDEDRNTLMKPEDFSKIVVFAVLGRYPNGAHINVNVDNVQELIQAQEDRFSVDKERA